MVLNPDLAPLTPVTVFQSIAPNRPPTVDAKIHLPFKIALSADLSTDEDIAISFDTNSILQANPIYYNIVSMTATA